MNTAPRRQHRYLVYAAVTAAVLGCWVALTSSGAVKPILLASPGDVWASLLLLGQHPGALIQPVGVTLLEMLAAFVIAAALAIPFGLLVGAYRFLTAAYEPILTTANALPLVILYPVLAAILGVGSSSKVVIGTAYAFFPIAIATLRSTATVDPRLVTAARTMGATSGQVLKSVLLPAVASPVIASMRVASGLALVTIIAAEFISGADGVGFELGTASQGLDTPTLFAWVGIACALTIAVNILFTTLTNTVQKGINR